MADFIMLGGAPLGASFPQEVSRNPSIAMAPQAAAISFPVMPQAPHG